MEKTHKEKLLEAGVKRYGSEKAWREAQKEFGLKANRHTPRGFATMDKELASEISKKAAQARWDKYRAEKEAAQE